ncbi:proton myo-inositol cotransporter [Colletotrichum lupini]|uniref:Proton myo-inositol cotransporter n=1 Tax=Colletotrichum lupini TaxID=145971 RepID=A0A9Q8T4D6_9PEZI|nr:proton myo-inositol cotransporter [Colletotrichum lupini]UQC88996.1 proton myo-inositol cotransporter [Colletotrichum lupini]
MRKAKTRTGMGPLPSIYFSEAFPLSYREIGSAFTICVNNAVGSALTLTFPELLHRIGPTGAFCFYAGLNLLAFVVIFFLIPETKWVHLHIGQKARSNYSLLVPGNGHLKSLTISLESPHVAMLHIRSVHGYLGLNEDFAKIKCHSWKNHDPQGRQSRVRFVGVDVTECSCLHNLIIKAVLSPNEPVFVNFGVAFPHVLSNDANENQYSRLFGAENTMYSRNVYSGATHSLTGGFRSAWVGREIIRSSKKPSPGQQLRISALSPATRRRTEITSLDSRLSSLTQKTWKKRPQQQMQVINQLGFCHVIDVLYQADLDRLERFRSSLVLAALVIHSKWNEVGGRQLQEGGSNAPRDNAVVDNQQTLNGVETWFYKKTYEYECGLGPGSASDCPRKWLIRLDKRLTPAEC